MSSNPYESPREEAGGSDEPHVHLVEPGVLLVVYDSDEQFAEVRDAFLQGLAVPNDIAIESVRSIHVSGATGPAPQVSWLRDRVALLGCGLVGFMAAFGFLYGVMQFIDILRAG